VDQEILVTEFRTAASEFEKWFGPVALMLLVAPDEETFDSWNVIVSAHGLNAKTRGEAVRLVSDTLRKTLTRAVWPTVARTTVLRTDDPFVQSFSRRYSTLRAGSTIESVTIAGADLPRAIVVDAGRKAA
jgi:hypothetical protein